MNSIIAGVDIGGTHITAALIDVKRRVILDNSLQRVAVDSKESADNIFTTWSNVIKQCFHSYNIKPGKIGMAMPGPFDYKQGVALMKNQDKFDNLYGLNVKDKLARLLQINAEDINIANDAACFLQGEIFHGAANDNDRIMGLTLGTGLGAARAMQMRSEDADLWSEPFKYGIAEDYLSSRWFVKRFYECTGKKVENVKELVRSDDPGGFVQAVFNEFGNNLGTFLKPFLEAEKRNVLIVGGSIAKAFDLFKEELEKALMLGDAIQIKKSVLGESAAMMGAASFCQQAYLSSSTVAW
ncbi:MAG TPA: ROK family protein [Flavisolibacter sp.]|nr:ROK family protein [Flavisolibacter sp.]